MRRECQAGTHSRACSRMGGLGEECSGRFVEFGSGRYRLASSIQLKELLRKEAQGCRDWLGVELV